MTQSKKELEEWYSEPDKWEYWKNKDDSRRKKEIMVLLDEYKTALDIGAGEGFITTDLPAKKIYAIELSDTARERLAPHIITEVPNKKFDLVVSCGTLYEQYEHEKMAELIKKHSKHHVLIAGIKEWLIDYDFGRVIRQYEFPYRGYTQLIRLYEITT